jgi:glutamate N-acetyltransferase/amino-acid N-acetyltransferase
MVASTGVIGAYLPMDKVLSGIADAAHDLNANNGALAAQAIMTTDTVSKEIAVQIELAGKTVTMGGMAKGSGMIHPDMATMLGFITTDAAITPELLQQILREAAAGTFNMVTVDGDTSTNDSLFALANGCAGNPVLDQASGPDYASFVEAITFVCEAIAKMIAKDGEGATKFLTIRIEGAVTLEEARKAARTVAGSSLVKAAIYGKDANWGRMICALGYSGIEFDPAKVDMFLGPIQVMTQGSGLLFDEIAAKEYFNQDDILAVIRLHVGDQQAEAWGCDLTHDYVSINADYRS